MSFFFKLQFLLLLVIIFSSICLVVSKNPIFSILFLILIFCLSSFVLILSGVDFIGLLFIIIYVGAIAVLFLFVVMMLDLKVELYTKGEIQKLCVFFIIFFSFFFFCLYFFDTFSIFDPFFNFSFTYLKLVDSLYNIDVFGQSLYNYFTLCFLVSGFILLVAMLGAIVLTLNYSGHRKVQSNLRQLSRKDTFLTYFF